MIFVIILALIQGITEFLPISSSGHLLIFEHFFDIEQKVAYTTLMHLGTLIAVIFFFKDKIIKIIKGVLKREKDSFFYLFFIAFGSVPAGLVGFFLKNFIEEIFENILLLPLFFLFTGVILLLTKFCKVDNKKIGVFSSILIGIAQAVAIIPGVSRSGTTISSGIFLKVERKEVFDFSFLLSIPAVLGANILEFKEITTEIKFLEGFLAIGVSFLTGILALFILKRSIITKRFWIFSFYCFGIAVITFIFNLTY